MKKEIITNNGTFIGDFYKEKPEVVNGYLYMIRSSSAFGGRPSTLEKNVAFNRYGYFVTDKEIPMKEDYLKIKKCHNKNKYTIKGYFTDRDEHTENYFGFIDKKHLQYTCEKTFETVSEATIFLNKLISDILAHELKDNGKSGKAEINKNGRFGAIFYFDGDISAYEVVVVK